MKLGKRTVVAAVLIAGSFAAVPLVEAATPPAVTAMIQGSDRVDDRDTLIVTGVKLNKFKTFGLTTDPGGATAGAPTLLVKGRTQITLLLPAGLAAGGYDLSLNPKKGDPLVVGFTLQEQPLLAGIDNIGAENGVWGSTDANDFAGVKGDAFGATGEGVFGEARNLGGAGVGVRGRSFGVDGIGVIANVTADGGPNSAALLVDHSGTEGVVARFQSQGGTVAEISHSGVGTFLGGIDVGLGLGTGQLNVNGSRYGGTTVDIATAQGDTIAFALSDPTGEEILFVRDFGGGGVFNLELFQGDAFKPGGGSWSVVSDARLKRDVEDLDGALDGLLKLRSVTFEYKDPDATHQAPGRQTGFIAQEVEQVFPEWVGENQDGMKYVAVKGFESLTVAALRELRSEKDAQIATLEARNAELERRVAEFESANEARLAALEKALLGTTEESVTSPTETSPKQTR